MFHDATVSGFVVHANELRIETEEFGFSPTEVVPPALIIISSVQSIHRNEVEVVRFEVESDDAEIYSLDGLVDGVRINLIWHFWKPKAPEVWCTYWFPGATLYTEALSGGPLAPVQMSSKQDT